MATTLTRPRMAADVDLSLGTLRCCERTGCLPRVQPPSNGYRRHGALELDWLELVRCLREAGMSIRLIHRHIDPTCTGDETIPERVVLNREHRTNVLAHTAEPQHHLDSLAWKPIYDADAFRVIAREATP